MIELQGQYNTAKVFTDNVDSTTISQIIELCNQSFVKDLNIRIMPDCHAGAGCVIGTTMTITDMVVPNLVGVDIGCLDKDTQFLSSSGWKNISDYANGDKVLQYNKDTDFAEFVEPINYIVKDCNSFYHFKNSKGLDQMVSEEHKMLVWQGYKGKGYKKIDYNPLEVSEKGLEHGFYGIKCSFNILQDGVEYSDDEIRFLIALSADGYIRKERNGKKFISFHLKKERKISRISQILNNLSVPFKNYSAKDSTTYIEFYIDSRFEKSLSFLWKANADQLKIASEESLLWDGHEGYRSFFSSCSKENADAIQFAFAATGIRAGIYESKSKKYKLNYIVIPTKNPVIGINKSPDLVESLDGKKYCFTVPSGYFVIRRNGNISITGNCGMHVSKISNKGIDLEKLDRVVRKDIPSGFAIRGSAHSYASRIEFEEIVAPINKQRAKNSIGTLGSGNHFLELDVDDEGFHYLVIHSGSRNMGKQIAEYWQGIATTTLKVDYDNSVSDIIQACVSIGKVDMIEEAKITIKKPPHKSLSYLQDENFEGYLSDMKIAQEFAVANREAMADTIVEKMGFDVVESFTTIHNYIDMDTMILRKGAVSAKAHERLIIPINMRDGSIIATGKGNMDWNFSAPHGAGRLMGRGEAKRTLNMEDYKNSMDGIYTTSVNLSTLDEAPMAYKNMDEIIENTKDTITVDKIIKPVYNYKDSGD